MLCWHYELSNVNRKLLIRGFCSRLPQRVLPIKITCARLSLDTSNWQRYSVRHCTPVHITHHQQGPNLMTHLPRMSLALTNPTRNAHRHSILKGPEFGLCLAWRSHFPTHRGLESATQSVTRAKDLAMGSATYFSVLLGQARFRVRLHCKQIGNNFGILVAVKSCKMKVVMLSIQQSRVLYSGDSRHAHSRLSGWLIRFLQPVTLLESILALMKSLFSAMLRFKAGYRVVQLIGSRLDITSWVTSMQRMLITQRLLLLLLPGITGRAILWLVFIFVNVAKAPRTPFRRLKVARSQGPLPEARGFFSENGLERPFWG